MNGADNRYDAAFKAKVALEGIRGRQTIAEIALAYGLHPEEILAWRKLAIDRLPDTFSGKGTDHMPSALGSGRSLRKNSSSR